MKPSERIGELFEEQLAKLPRSQVGRQEVREMVLLRAVVNYLDEDADRHAKPESEGIIGKTEHGDLVFGIRRDEPDPTRPLYVGDGAPNVRRYEPDSGEGR